MYIHGPRGGRGTRRACINAYTFKYVHIHTHTRMFIHIRAHAYTYAHIHTHTRTCIRIRVFPYTCVHIHTHTRISIHTRAYPYTYAYIHTHTRPCKRICACIRYPHTYIRTDPFFLFFFFSPSLLKYISDGISVFVKLKLS